MFVIELLISRNIVLVHENKQFILHDMVALQHERSVQLQ